MFFSLKKYFDAEFSRKKNILASKVQEKNILIQDFTKKNDGKFRKQYFVMKRQKIKCFKQSGEKNSG